MPQPRLFRVIGTQVHDDQRRRVLAYEYDPTVFGDGAGEPSVPSGCATVVGTLVKSTGGAGAQQSVTVPGIPRAVMFWSDGALVDGTWRAGYLSMLGFATPTEQAGGAVASEDAAAVSNTGRVLSNTRAISFVDPSLAIIAGATVTIVDSTITLTWTINDSNAFLIHYQVFMGDAMAADLVTFLTPGVNGAQVITGAAFQADAALFLHAGGVTAWNTPSGNAHLGLGAAAANLNQWGLCASAADGFTTMQCARVMQASDCIFLLRGDASSDGQARVTAWAPDGFTLSWQGHSLAGFFMIALLLRGCQLRVGSFAKSTVGNDIVSLGHRSGGVLLASASIPSGSAPDAVRSVGATDGVTHATAHLQDDDGIATSNVDAISRTDRTLLLGADFSNPPGPFGAEATVTLESTGFRIAYSPQGGADLLGYLSVG